MTAIAAVTDGRRVWIGGDSAGVDSRYSLQSRADEKVFVNGPMIFGFCGSFRMGQVLRYAVEIPKRHPDADIDKWMATVFIDAIRGVMRAKGTRWKDKGVEELLGSFLVGYQGRLFQIYEDYQVASTIEGYDAAGAGTDIALGALCVATGEPRTRIRKALEAAEKFNAAVRGPFTIKSGGAAR